MNLTLTNINKQLGPKSIFRDFDMTVEDGQTVSVLGASGMGKSTLLKLIIGFMEPESGSIRLGDVEITGKTEKQLREIRKQHMAMVFQSPALLNSLTIRENMELGLKERGVDQKKIDRLVLEKLEIVGLAAEIDNYPMQLSGGMQKRVGVARALALEPQLILYDEPTSGLDPINAHGIFKVIRELKLHFGITSIVVTHDVVGALYISDKMGLLHHGQLVEYTTPDKFRKSSNKIAQQFLFPVEERKTMIFDNRGNRIVNITGENNPQL